MALRWSASARAWRASAPWRRKRRGASMRSTAGRRMLAGTGGETLARLMAVRRGGMDARRLVVGAGAGGAADRAADPLPSIKPARMRPSFLPLAVLAIASLLPACKTAGEGQAGAPSSDIFAGGDEEKVRLALYDYADGFSATVQRASHAIAEASGDLAIRRRAVHWKIQSIPVIRSIVARPDPRSALADAWTYTLQMHQYFREGKAPLPFGEQQPLAVAASAALESDFDRMASSLL